MSKERTYKKKRGLRRALQIIGIILASAALSTICLGALGGEITNPLEKDRNPDNLLVVDENYIESQNNNHGVEIDVAENGTIKLSGEATSDWSLKITELKLPAGTYTLSGMEDPNVDECYLYLNYGNSQAIAGTESATFTIDDEMTVSVNLSWKEGTKFNLFNYHKIQPVLVEGETAGSFYE